MLITTLFTFYRKWNCLNVHQQINGLKKNDYGPVTWLNISLIIWVQSLEPTLEGENKLFLFVCLFVWDRLLLCSYGCSGTHYVDQAGLELKDSTCLSLLSIGIKGVYHHTHFENQLLKVVSTFLYMYHGTHTLHSNTYIIHTFYNNNNKTIFYFIENRFLSTIFWLQFPLSLILPVHPHILSHPDPPPFCISWEQRL